MVKALAVFMPPLRPAQHCTLSVCTDSLKLPQGVAGTVSLQATPATLPRMRSALHVFLVPVLRGLVLVLSGL